VWPSDKVQTFLFDDDYSFGILQSDAHWQWFLEKCSKLKSDFSYSTDAVFDTYPWPQAPTNAQVERVAKAHHYLINSGPFAGRDQRDVVNEAIAWWEAYLDAIDKAAAS
jgi:hypothetical protein